jgi:hypothetical protein
VSCAGLPAASQSGSANSPAPSSAADSPATIRKLVTDRFDKLMNVSVSYTREDDFVAMGYFDHWKGTIRRKDDLLWNEEDRVAETDATIKPGSPYSRIIWSVAPAKDLQRRKLMEVDYSLFTKPSGDGPATGRFGDLYGMEAEHGTELFIALGIIAPQSLDRKCLKATDLLKGKMESLDPDHVRFTVEDPKEQEQRTWTLDRSVGYAIVEVTYTWFNAHQVIKAAEFKDFNGMLLPTKLTTTFRNATCHGIKDTLHGQYAMTQYILKDPKNTTASFKIDYPPGTEVHDDRKEAEEKMIAGLPKGSKVIRNSQGNIVKILPPSGAH